MALPVNGSTHLIPAYYSFYRPRKDERLSWRSWLTYSGWLTHNSGHPSAAGRAQDRESSPTRDRRSTTVPRHQLSARIFLIAHWWKTKKDKALRVDNIAYCVLPVVETEKISPRPSASVATVRARSKPAFNFGSYRRLDELYVCCWFLRRRRGRFGLSLLFSQ